jgi:hypothetical protein
VVEATPMIWPQVWELLLICQSLAVAWLMILLAMDGWDDEPDPPSR